MPSPATAGSRSRGGALGLPQATTRPRSRSGASPRLSVLFTLHTPVYATITAVCTIFLYVSYVLPTALGAWAYGRTWTAMGPWDLGRWYRPLAVLSVAGLRRADRHRDAAAQPAINLGHWWVWARACDRVVRARATSFPHPTAREARCNRP